MKLIFLIAGGGGFVFALIRRPEIIAIILFTLVIAGIDVYYLRPVLTLALFGRVIVDKHTMAKFSSYLGLPYVKLLIVFLVYGIFVSLSQDLFTYDLFKGDLDTIMLTYFVYYFYFKNGNANHVKAAMIAAALICFADLAYTYIVFGSFPMHRIYSLFTGSGETVDYQTAFAGINWNFFGQICGMGFIYLLCDYIKSRKSNKLSIWLLPVMLLGVLMSTSRSAILGLLVITILIILNSINFREQKKRVAKIGMLGIGAIMLSMLLFATVGKYLNLDSGFIDGIVSRLSDEPIAMVKKALGQPYNIHNLGSMDWREESAENAYSAYMNMDLKEQMFGIGYLGFETRNIGHGFDAHNATLLLLIEDGLVGFTIYFILIGGLIFQSIVVKNYSPSLFVLGFIIIYGLAQNREWIGWTTFIFVGCILTEIEYLRFERKNQRLVSQGSAIKLSPKSAVTK